MNDIDLENLFQKIDYLKFRGILLTLNVEEIVSAIETIDDYKEFLDTVDFTLYHDQYFFILKNFSSKTLSILKECSIKFSTKGNVRQKENSIIGDMNILESEIDIEGRKKEYFSLENSFRLKLPKTENEIYDSMAGDYNVLYQITKALDTNKPIENVECRQFLETTEFFLISLPEFYTVFDEAASLSIDYLQDVPKIRNYKINREIHKIKKKLKTYK